MPLIKNTTEQAPVNHTNGRSFMFTHRRWQGSETALVHNKGTSTNRRKNKRRHHHLRVVMTERATVERHRATAATPTQRPLRVKSKVLDATSNNNSAVTRTDRGDTEFRQICMSSVQTQHEPQYTHTATYNSHAFLLVTRCCLCSFVFISQLFVVWSPSPSVALHDVCLVMKTGVIHDATGSAYIEINNTKILCGVYVLFLHTVTDISLSLFLSSHTYTHHTARTHTLSLSHPHLTSTPHTHTTVDTHTHIHTYTSTHHTLTFTLLCCFCLVMDHAKSSKAVLQPVVLAAVVVVPEVVQQPAALPHPRSLKTVRYNAS